MKDLGVKVWQEAVSIPTYGIGKPDKNPMFFEKRVYQGSSGVVYPNPVIEKIEDEKQDKIYQAVFLENRYLKIMILPQLGGRVQMAYDKIKERHFIYYNQVIKPALVGLTGPWISGGIEFNWPQHHRPSTFEPVDVTISENSDGSRTVWVNEVERMFRTKGMAGFTLHPDRAYLEIKAQLFNRTPLPQTFLWWANPAVKVNDDYQSIFPPDVNAVFDHGKRDVSSFPIATGTYYKVDYSPGTDISRYRNIPVPTSYMAVNSEYDFMGGYEHDTQAGLLHVADHHVSPGKKQWTWGHSDFGQAWDRNLTDEDGPYIELMTGVFTDNQPDFSWLMPYEEKTFTQYFLPYRELGQVKNATKDILVALDLMAGKATIKIMVTSEKPGCNLIFRIDNDMVFKGDIDLAPEFIFEKEIAVPPTVTEAALLLQVLDNKGKELIRYEPGKDKKKDMPEPAKPSLPPHKIENNEQLFLTGQHLEQYRHATYSPVPYYEEALKRDANDIRNNNALGVWYLRRGRYQLAEPYLRKAVATSVARNPNPYDGEPYYNLGLCLLYQDRPNEAYAVFYKATWNKAWQDAAFFSLAQIDMARGDHETALDHINKALDRNQTNGKAWVIKAAALRKMGAFGAAIQCCEHALERDRFNLGALFELSLLYRAVGDHGQADTSLSKMLSLSRRTDHNLLEYALDQAAAGLFSEALNLLNYADVPGASPLVYYHMAFFAGKAGQTELSNIQLTKAAAADPYLCFPNRSEDIAALQYAIAQRPADAKALYYLGNLWYDKRQYDEAIACWERSVTIDGDLPTAHRNLGIASFNKLGDPQKALFHFEKAFGLDKTDARVLMELDQLYKRLNRSSQERLDNLEKNRSTADERDDLYLERASLYNFDGRFEKAYQLLMERKFHPWEGGEGKVSGQYIFSLTEMAKENIQQGNYEQAIIQLESARIYPHNLGEGKLFGAQENDILYWLGVVYEKLTNNSKAAEYFKEATKGSSEPGVAMFYNDQQPDKIFYQGLAWQKLGDEMQARQIFKTLADYGEQHINDEVVLDYFAVSLPNLLVFDDDLQIRNRIHCQYMIGLGQLGLDQKEQAINMLTQVLELDKTHFGAKTHLALISAWELTY